MTFSELKEMIETLEEEYDSNYLSNKEVVVQYQNGDKCKILGIYDWKFNQSADEKMDGLYIRCDDETKVFE